MWTDSDYKYRQIITQGVEVDGITVTPLELKSKQKSMTSVLLKIIHSCHYDKTRRRDKDVYKFVVNVIKA